jgi:uncharacterized protein (DUF1330 family)
MSCYVLVALTSTSSDWQADYGPAVMRLVVREGGRYLARTTDFERVEGDDPKPGVWVIVEFPDREAAMRFYDDPEYEPFRRSRWAGSFGTVDVVNGRDDFAPS